jgi:hypothetical protein
VTQGPTIYPAAPIPMPQFGMPELSKAQILAVKSLFSGTATQPQQQMALEVIIVHLAKTYEVCVDPKSLMMHEGSRMVGNLLLQINNMTMKEEKPS